MIVRGALLFFGLVGTAVAPATGELALTAQQQRDFLKVCKEWREAGATLPAGLYAVWRPEGERFWTSAGFASTMAVYNRAARRVELFRDSVLDWRDWPFKTILRHEVGHAAGLGHAKCVWSEALHEDVPLGEVMCPYQGRAERGISDWDRAALRLVGEVW